jgi:hypothetical protein
VPNTHCLPTGSLGTGELPVPDIISTYTISDPGAGNRRGIVIFIHGLSSSPVGSVQPVPNSGGALVYLRVGDFETAVVADGWVFVYPSVQEDFYTGTGWAVGGVYNDVSNDSGHGSRYMASTNHWATHLMVNEMTRLYGANRPIILAGFSMGAFKVLQLAATPPAGANVVGYISHCPATLFEAVGPTLTQPFNFYNLNWTGLDTTTTQLNAVTIPGIVGYGTQDGAVGWGSTTVAAGSNGVAVSTFAGAGILNVVASSKLAVFGGTSTVQVTGLTGGTGSALITFTGTGTNTLTGCTTVIGSGTLATGNPCNQSFTDQMIINAIAASQPVTRNATTDDHEFTGTPSGAGNDAATYAAWIASTIDPSNPVSF